MFDRDVAATLSWIDVGVNDAVDTNGSNTSQSFGSAFASLPYVWTSPQTYSQGG